MLPGFNSGGVLLGPHGGGGGSVGLLDGLSPRAAWSASRDLLTSFVGNPRYTIDTGVDSWKDQTGNGFHAANTGDLTQPAIVAVGPNSRNSLDFTADFLDCVAISNLIANSAGYLIVSFIADTINTNAGNSYSNDQLMADTGGYMGIFLRKTDANPLNPQTSYAYNWDGNEDNAPTGGAVNIVPGTPYVFEWRHEGGNLYQRVNAGSWSSATASGNTQVLTGILRFGSTLKWDGKICEAAIWGNGGSIPSSGNQDIIAASFKSWFGA